MKQNDGKLRIVSRNIESIRKAYDTLKTLDTENKSKRSI
jgi:hypothetical protein